MRQPSEEIRTHATSPESSVKSLRETCRLITAEWKLRQGPFARPLTGLSALYRRTEREQAEAKGGCHVPQCGRCRSDHPGVGVSNHLGRWVVARRPRRKREQLVHNSAPYDCRGIATPSRLNARSSTRAASDPW